MYERSEIDPIIEYQKYGFWQDNGFSYNPLHDIGPTRTLNFFVDPNSVLSSSLLELVKQSLGKWGAVADIQFVQTFTQEDANIVFNEEFFSASEGGTSFINSDTSTPYIDQAIIEVSSALLLKESPEKLFDTFIHEIGHALGLGHPGNYNGSASFADANFSYDSKLVSSLSYIYPEENPNVPGDALYTSGPMASDIYAIRDLYAASNVVHDGNTDHVFQSVTSQMHRIASTVIDGGGIDRISALGETGYTQEIFLDGSSPSSILGGTSNLLIMNGTVIENFLGGDSNDIVHGNSSDNLMEGGGGNDILKGDLGENILDGGSGIDTARYEPGGLSLVIARTSESDPLFVESFNYDPNTESGDYPSILGGGDVGDIFDSLYGIEKIETGDGNDTIFIRGYGAWSGDQETGNLVEIHSGSGSDFVEGSDARDHIFGGQDADWLYGHEDAAEEFSGMPQNGVYDGDTIHGGEGDDHIFGYEAEDSLFGDDGEDFIRGNSGADTINGGLDDDVIEGGYHEDVISGDGGNDILWGFESSESLVDMDLTTNEAKFRAIGAFNYSGEWNANVINGGSGNDYLIGSGGDDTLSGGADDDVLYGDHGSDMLTGGSGSDVFVFHGSWVNTLGAGGSGDDDYILDFNSADDQILLSKPQTPNDDPNSPWYQDPSDPYYTGFGWEFEANRIVFTYQEAAWDSNGEKIWIDREGAALHLSDTYDMSDIYYVDDFAFA